MCTKNIENFNPFQMPWTESEKQKLFELIEQ